MNIPNPKIVLTEISETPGTPSFGTYTRDSNGDHKVTYLQHPNLSTGDKASPLSPVALLPQS
jgi:hypothetical protein